VAVELLFLPVDVRAVPPYRGRDIAEVLSLTVDEAAGVTGSKTAPYLARRLLGADDARSA
jgi:hypothetical protein